MTWSLYDATLLQPGAEVTVTDGAAYRAVVPVEVWTGPVTPGDESLLARAHGPVLDVGCGPGRLTAALRHRDVEALGIDVAPAAVQLTARRGGRALQRSVFDPLPGGWACILLADGNIGIGGDPARLLRRVAQLLAPGGRVLVELDRPGTAAGAPRLRLESAAGERGGWFAWARVAADDVEALAAGVGLAVAEQWETPVDGGRRWFVALQAATADLPAGAAPVPDRPEALLHDAEAVA